MLLVAATARDVRADLPIYYQTDFQSGVGPEWSSKTTQTAGNVGTVLGAFGRQAVTLSLHDLPQHDRLLVTFDLLIASTWDGNDVDAGPDVFRVTLDGVTALQTTFSEAPEKPQSYPDAYPGGGSHPGGTGALEQVIFWTNEDDRYRITLALDHVATGADLVWEGVSLQELPDEAWALDNVRVTLASDTDGDGVDDSQESPVCLGSEAGQPTTTVGCTATQVCPCAAPLGRHAWTSRGEYRRCIDRALDEMVRDARASLAQRTLLRRAAQATTCGRDD
ncbi:MAG TPA: hypothetical protein VGR62_11880 [Candidatus Binatia bacterium]|nr:hypothetical protein [Candidatus Binatia bacterium]